MLKLQGNNPACATSAATSTGDAACLKVMMKAVYSAPEAPATAKQKDELHCC